MNEKKQAGVLIVEDNPVVCQTLRGIVAHDERLINVGQTPSGEAAIELVNSLRPDVVCLDIMLPGIGGLEVLRAIRLAHPNIRVILVTGSATSDVVQGALKLGASGFVLKPFNAKKLLDTIQAALNKPAAPPLVEEPTPAPLAEPAAPVEESTPAALAEPATPPLVEESTSTG